MVWDDYNKLSSEMNNDPLFEEVDKLISKKSFFTTSEVRNIKSIAAKTSMNRPEVKEKLSKSMKAVHARPEIKEKRLGIKNPEVKEKLSKSMKEIQKELHKDPEYTKSRANAIREISIGKSLKERQIKIKTPDGVFNTRTEAAKHYGVHSVTILRWIRNDPDNFSQIK